MPANAEILFDRRGAAGLVTLNRPQALNAVTHDMVRKLAHMLAVWAKDDAVTRVIVTAAGERAFSAGGDLRAIYDLHRAGRLDEALAYWRDEYRLNAFIKHYGKPYVALIDGVIMGGGVGIAIHGSHRVAGDRFRFAMPECGIGFFPDVGASWFLPRLPGEIGTYCGLTGERLDATDAVKTGLATHRAASVRFPDLLDALCSNVPVDAVIGAFAEPPAAAPEILMRSRPAIDRLFRGDDVENLLAGLDAAASESEADAAFADTAAALIRAKSPTSLKVTLALLRRGRMLDFDECMRTEFRVASRIAAGHDFYEGIRSVIIDKDRAPRWHPSALKEVSGADLERYFAPLPAELALS
ncbi:MAG TPA: enoyl-CoA hydratase/isomerase family protein [Xanthobacteraceae bacterium]